MTEGNIPKHLGKQLHAPIAADWKNIKLKAQVRNLRQFNNAMNCVNGHYDFVCKIKMNFIKAKPNLKKYENQRKTIS